MKNSNVPPFCPICNSKLIDSSHQMNYTSGTKFCPIAGRHYSVTFKYRSPTGQFNMDHEHVTQEEFKDNGNRLIISYAHSDAYPTEPNIITLSYDILSREVIKISKDLFTTFRPKEYKKFINFVLDNIAFL